MSDRKRLLVMNGSRVVQREHDGTWITEKVDRAGTLKPGIYNIFNAAAVDKGQAVEGPIVHVDKDQFYQRVGKSFVMHQCTDFDKVPAVGSTRRIGYDDEGRGLVQGVALSLGRRRSR